MKDDNFGFIEDDLGLIIDDDNGLQHRRVRGALMAKHKIHRSGAISVDGKDLINDTEVMKAIRKTGEAFKKSKRTRAIATNSTQDAYTGLTLNLSNCPN